MSVAGSPTGAIRQQSGPRQWRRRAARSTRSAVTRWGSRDRRRRSRRVTGGGGDRVAPGGRPAVQSTPVMGTAPRHVWVDGRVVEATEPVPPVPAAHLETGLHLVTSSVRRDPENPLIGVKTTSRADYVHARIEARSADADDALFLTIDGHLSEATSANVFLVRGDELATPVLACAILAGTPRDWILRWASGVGLRPA